MLIFGRLILKYLFAIIGFLIFCRLLISLILCFLRLILIDYNGDRFQGPSITSRQLFFLLALRGRTKCVRHILRWFKQIPDFQDLLEILNEPHLTGVFLSQMISQLKMCLLLLLTILTTNKLFNANLRII